MPFDSVAATALAGELRETIVGGRVQGVVMSGPLTLVLELYRGGLGRIHLVLSAHPQQARAHLSRVAPSRDPNQHPPFLLLLRKYARGGTITDVQQPPHERVLRLSIDKRIAPDKRQEYHFGGDFGQREGVVDRGSGIGERGSEDGEAWEQEDENPQSPTPDPQWPITRVSLYIEIMGRLSNIVLVDDDGVILDAIKRIPPSLNRYRSTLPHQPYLLPPPQEKRDPLRASPNILSAVMSEVAGADKNAPVWRGLVEGFRGISPTLAREVVYRAFGDTATKADSIAGRPRELDQVGAMLRHLMSGDITESATVAWRELADPDDDPSNQPLDFAPYRLTYLAATGAALTEHTSISEAIETYYNAASVERLGGHAALKGRVRAELNEMLGREERKLRALQDELTRSQSLEKLRLKGEMILAYMHTLEPGQTTLKIEDEGLTIALDPALTPVENAQALFREYRKAQSAQEGLPEKIAGAQASVDYWDGLITSLDLAATYDDIRAVQEELRSTRKSFSPTIEQKPTGNKQKAARNKKLPQPLSLRTRHGAHLLVGRTAGQNDTATFRLASPDDLWLHVRGAPGSHVILRAEGGYTESDLEEAAALAAAYSKLRNEGYVDVIVTEKRNVRKVAGGPPGAVTYKGERVVRVKPA